MVEAVNPVLGKDRARERATDRKRTQWTGIQGMIKEMYGGGGGGGQSYCNELHLSG